MRIEVTQEDIDNGARNCNVGCPIARAIRRCTGEAYVSVGYDGASAGPSLLESKRFRLPADVSERIVAFDSPGGVMVPFAFDLEV